MQELLSLSQAAARLGIHPTTLRTWVRGGRVPAYRLGRRFTRVDWSELLQAIATRRPASAGSSHPSSDHRDPQAATS
jgi:excisionase family DNA binding protein